MIVLIPSFIMNILRFSIKLDRDYRNEPLLHSNPGIISELTNRKQENSKQKGIINDTWIHVIINFPKKVTRNCMAVIKERHVNTYKRSVVFVNVNNTYTLPTPHVVLIQSESILG